MELYRDGAVIRLGGQVDGRSTADLRDVLTDELDRTSGDLVLDLAAVESVDLTALRTIAAASRHATLNGHRLLLRGCSPLVRRLLHLTHLRGLVEYDDPVVADRTA
jgi:anti-anti-sigma factor